MKRVLTVVIALFFTTSLYGVSSDSMQESISKNIQKGLDMLSSDQEAVLEDPAKLFDLVDPFFNYTLMARLSLGNAWNSLDNSQKREFVTKYEQKLKEGLLMALEFYSDETVNVKEPKKQGTRIHMPMEIESGGETYSVLFKFHEAKEDDWLIYDLDIVGVSVVQSFRNIFASYDGKSFDNLINLLDQDPGLEDAQKQLDKVTQD